MNMKFVPTITVNRRIVPLDTPAYEVRIQEDKGRKWWLRGWVTSIKTRDPRGSWVFLSLEDATQYGGHWGPRSLTKEEAVRHCLSPAREVLEVSGRGHLHKELKGEHA